MAADAPNSSSEDDLLDGVLHTQYTNTLESIADGETGFLRPQEPEQWAEAVGSLLSDSARQKSMGEAGRWRATSMFSLESFARILDQQIRSLVAGAEGAPGRGASAAGGGTGKKDTGVASPVAARTRSARRRKSTAKGDGS